MMRNFAATLSLSLLVGGAQADITQFSAVISSGPQQVTPSGSPAIGTLFGEYDSDLNMFSFNWDISDNLIGAPSDPGSHLHQAPSGVAGPIVFAFQNPDGTWPLAGMATWTDLTTSQVDALFAGNIYANFHTTAFPAGEVRGQISVVPTPAGLGVLAIAGAAGCVRRRRA